MNISYLPSVASLTIRAAAWLKSSRLRPGVGLGGFLVGFFVSCLSMLLVPMSTSLQRVAIPVDFKLHHYQADARPPEVHSQHICGIVLSTICSISKQREPDRGFWCRVLVSGFGVRRDWSFVASAAEKALKFDDPVFLRTASLSRQASGWCLRAKTTARVKWAARSSGILRVTSIL